MTLLLLSKQRHDFTVLSKQRHDFTAFKYK